MSSGPAQRTGPYKLTGEVRERVQGALRSGLTLREAAVLVGLSPSTIYKFCRAGTPEADRFADQIEQARVDGQPYRGARPVAITAAKGPSPGLSGADTAQVEIMGMRVEPVLGTVAMYEAAFLLGVSVNQLRKLIRDQDAETSSPNSNMVATVGNRRRLKIEWLLGRPEITQCPIAAVLATRLVEGRLEIPGPARDSAAPESHIVVVGELL
jgi:hypothetical protein